MQEVLKQFFQSQGNFLNEFNLGISSNHTFKDIELKLGIELPQDFKNFLMLTNGFEGFVGETYCRFNKLEEILENTKNHCEDFFSWAIHIGSNGGSEMYVLDKRGKQLVYGILPAIGDDGDFIILGESFEQFIKHLFDDDFWE
ncbi:MAG: hypothetical protein JWQ25_3053 [Daejeonella sp.]|nr:hypothetical protein [Daejeonella sp.]